MPDHDEPSDEGKEESSPLPDKNEEQLRKVCAQLGEHFDAAIVVVPYMTDGEPVLRIMGVGHPAFWKGLLSESHRQIFAPEAD